MHVCARANTHTHNPASPRDYRCQELLVQKLISDPQGRRGTRCEFKPHILCSCSCSLPNWPSDLCFLLFGKASGCPGVVPYGEKASSALKYVCNPTFSSSLLTATHALQLQGPCCSSLCGAAC